MNPNPNWKFEAGTSHGSYLMKVCLDFPGSVFVLVPDAFLTREDAWLLADWADPFNTSRTEVP